VQIYIDLLHCATPRQVRNNLFDGVGATERLAQKSCSQNAFYLDDEMSGYQFYNNTIKNAAVGILLGGGRDNSITHNHFENNINDIHFDARGLTWQQNYCNANCTSKEGYQPAVRTYPPRFLVAASLPQSRSSPASTSVRDGRWDIGLDTQSYPGCPFSAFDSSLKSSTTRSHRTAQRTLTFLASSRTTRAYR
jgi:parallel beta-helix repeat protein